MKLKLDENGHAVLSDGKPVYVHDDGKEVAFDAVGTVQTISRLNAEAKQHRERAEAFESKYKPFEGIEDAAAARKALETVKSLDQKKLIDAGEVETVKAEIAKAMQAQIDAAMGRAQTLEQQLYQEKIGGSFGRSKFIADKVAVPADMVQATFGKSFAIEEGKVVAKDANGNKIFSRSRPGELADFDEALETLIEQYPYRDHILKASGQSGSGAGPAAGTGAPKQPSGDLGGGRKERTAAIASMFPDLPKG